MDQYTRQEHKIECPWICGQQNVRAFARDNTEQNTESGYTPSPTIQFKIPDSTGLEGRDSTNYATATNL